MKITFYQEDGRVGARYETNDTEADNLSCLVPLGEEESLHEGDIGCLPPQIQKKDAEKIWKYVERKCKQHHQKCINAVKRAYDERCRRMDNVDQIIETEHDGVELKGRIVNHKKSGGVRVTLEEPYRSRKGYVFDYPNCFAEAMAGARVFDDRTGGLTQKVLGDAEEAIIDLYQEEHAKRAHPKEVSMVEALNQQARKPPKQAARLVKELNRQQKRGKRK